MRIGIDIRYLSHGLVGGVHTYVANFVPVLLDLAREHEVFLYADSKRRLELGRLPSHATLRILSWRNALSSVYQDLTLRRVMAADRLDVAHFPANYGFAPANARSVITLHDAINILPLREIVRGHPKNPRTLAMMTYLHVCSTLALQRADLVLTVSRYAAREIVCRGALRPDRVVPIPHGLSPDLRRITDPAVLADVRRRHDLPAAFVLADALKNPAVLVKAWRMLPPELRRNRQIVFFSRRPDPLPIVRQAVDAGEARLLIRVSRADLIALYSMADVFAFPSWIEGFGLPILEAMRCGAPVVASDRGALPEVVGEAGLLVDAEDAAGFATHVESVLSSPYLADELRRRGVVHASRFSWQRTAAAILESYTRALASPAPGHMRAVGAA